MKNLRIIGTSTSIATFVVVGLSGVAMFFDIKFTGLKEAHEYIGLVMFIAVIAHVLANFAPFKSYFKLAFKSAALWIMSLIIVASVAIIASTKPNEAKGLQKDIYKIVLQMKADDALQTFKADKIKLETLLASKGASYENLNIKDLAKKANLKETDILKAIINK